MSTRRLAQIALLTSAFLWGISPPLIKYTLSYITALNYLYFRFLFVSLLLIIPLYFRLKSHPVTIKQLGWYLLLGLLSTPLSLLFLFWGLEKTTAIDSTLIGIISPIFIVLGGLIVLKEKITKLETFGISLTFLGTIATIIQPLFETKPNPVANIEGNILVLIGTIIGAAYALLYKKYKLLNLDPFILVAISFLLGLVIVSLLITFTGTQLSLPLVALPGVIYMAVFGSAIAYFAYAYGISKIEASKASLYTYLQPIFAVPISVVILHEQITPYFLIGAVLIVVGVIITESKSSPN